LGKLGRAQSAKFGFVGHVLCSLLSWDAGRVFNAKTSADQQQAIPNIERKLGRLFGANLRNRWLANADFFSELHLSSAVLENLLNVASPTGFDTFGKDVFCVNLSERTGISVTNPNEPFVFVFVTGKFGAAVNQSSLSALDVTNTFKEAVLQKLNAKARNTISMFGDSDRWVDRPANLDMTVGEVANVKVFTHAVALSLKPSKRSMQPGSALSAPRVIRSIWSCRWSGGNSGQAEIDPWLMPMASPSFTCEPKCLIASVFFMRTVSHIR
jgi:hypothetical protein